MLNSSNYTTAPNTLRAGEAVAMDPKDFKDPNAKFYFHLVPGAKFTMPDGAEIIFVGGVYCTSSKDIQKELDKIANNGTSLIVTDKKKTEAYLQQFKHVAEVAARPASEGKSI